MREAQINCVEILQHCWVPPYIVELREGGGCTCRPEVAWQRLRRSRYATVSACSCGHPARDASICAAGEGAPASWRIRIASCRLSHVCDDFLRNSSDTSCIQFSLYVVCPLPLLLSLPTASENDTDVSLLL